MLMRRVTNIACAVAFVCVCVCTTTRTRQDVFRVACERAVSVCQSVTVPSVCSLRDPRARAGPLESY